MASGFRTSLFCSLCFVATMIIAMDHEGKMNGVSGTVVSEIPNAVFNQSPQIIALSVGNRRSKNKRNSGMTSAEYDTLRQGTNDTNFGKKYKEINQKRVAAALKKEQQKVSQLS
ncbi:hypothetical protein KBC04_04620 [Candidatus Babeliales bacterium]|nr:hypothetical protein [Candidatus Babeliales bacterium]MBP9844105.1 hypothetical protein [Candidatus Babeliales bacterium]